MNSSRSWNIGLRVACLGLAALAAIAVPAAAADLPFRAGPTLTVSGTQPIEIGDLMPGDTLPAQTITIAATGTVRYTLRSRIAGSAALAHLVDVTIVSRTSGAVLYKGPLADAVIGTRAPSPPHTLTDETDVLLVETWLPASAGNAVQGASLTIQWVVQATELGAP